MAVGATLAQIADQAPAAHRSDLITAGVLHDIGYRPDLATTGFHPLDGAANLAATGFSPLICDLVATHTLATREATTRGISLAAFAPYVLAGDPDVERLRQLVTWADLTCSPTGQRITVDERLADILTRYEPATPVHQYVTEHQQLLRRLGHQPPAPPPAPVEPLLVTA